MEKSRINVVVKRIVLSHTVTIYGTFQRKVYTTKPQVLIPILSNKNLNVKNDDIINGNYISTYDQVHSGNGELKN